MSGDEVKKLQEDLNLWGEKLTTDGQFGPDTDRAIQRFQSSTGIPVDGIYGPMTARALEEKVKYLRVAPTELVPVSGSAIISQPIQEAGDKVHAVVGFDERTEKNIATLLPIVQKKAREFMSACLGAGMPVKIICGNRTYAEQDELYAQGRTQSGDIVTYAKGGQSNHNFSLAFDIGLFPDGKYVDDSPAYDQAGGIGKSVGLEWGGDFKGKKQDKPHFQYPTDYTLKECRDMVEAGEWPPDELKA